MAICENCGKETSNPRFCSRSCAAQKNNRGSPKRAPQGTCQSCGIAIPKSRTHCPACREKAAAENDKTATAARIWLSERIVFTSHVSGTYLNADSRVGEFLDVFDNVAAMCPRYLPPGDWLRHRQILQTLRTFADFQPRGDWRRKLPVVDFSLSSLPFVLRHWVFAVTIARGAHALAPTFALETARVLWAHAAGRTVFDNADRLTFSIEAMVQDLDPSDSREIADQQLKKEITQRTLKRLEVIAEVPADVQITVFKAPVNRSAGKMSFVVDRCHLSESWSSSTGVELWIEGAEWPFDLSDGFELPGTAVLTLMEPLPKDRWEWWTCSPSLTDQPKHGDRLATGLLPVRWITHVVTSDYPDRVVEPLPDDWSTATGLGDDSGEISPPPWRADTER